MDERTLYKAWGQRIAERRRLLNLHQSDLAAMVGVSQQRISTYETGERRPPDALRPKLAAALQSDVAELFAYEQEPAA